MSRNPLLALSCEKFFVSGVTYAACSKSSCGRSMFIFCLSSSAPLSAAGCGGAPAAPRSNRLSVGLIMNRTDTCSGQQNKSELEACTHAQASAGITGHANRERQRRADGHNNGLKFGGGIEKGTVPHVTRRTN